MMDKSDKSQLGNSATIKLRFKIFLSRIALAWESLWQSLFWPVMVAGLFALALFSGVFGALPYAARLVALGIVGLIFLYSFKGLLKVRWPGKQRALKRLEKNSNLPHRPLTAWYDQIAGEKRPDGSQTDPSSVIWQAHQKQQQDKLAQLSPALPRSGWINLDHGGWRFTLALLVLVAVVLTGGDWRGQLAGAVSGDTKKNELVKTTMDAWISPPAFTKKAPLLLTSAVKKEAIARGEPIVVPEGSMLKIRINGVKTAGIVVSKQTSVGQPEAVLKKFDLLPRDGDNVVEKQFKLERPVKIAVDINGKAHSDWEISLIPDAAPKVEISKQINITPTGGFAVNWLASDDYGVMSLRGKISLVESGDKKGQTNAEPLVFKAPEFAVSLPKLNPKSASGKVFRDLTAHPWAGQKVSLVLEARDQAGQTGRSEPIEFFLPKKRFSKPLAKAIVEQRSRLVKDVHAKTGVLRVFAALMAWPEGLFKKSGNYVSMRVVARKLYRGQSSADLKKSVNDLWQLALTIDGGDLSATRRALEAARRALQEALARGASKKEIAKLTKNLKKALNDYMAAMQRQMQQALAKNQNSPNGLQRNGKQIRARDLQKMMDNIERLAKSGANDAAQQMLSQLENILKNLNPDLAQRPMDPQRTPAEAKMIEQLTKMMRRQRELMDKTFKMPRAERNRQQSQNQQQQNQNGQRKQSQQGNPLGKKLGSQQEQLKNLLGKMMQSMRDGGLKTPRALRQAQRQMDKAAKALKNGQKGPALGMQGNALKGLRKGAEAMAKEMMARGRGEEGNYGKHSETEASKNDPLGRPMPRDGADLGPNENMLPKESQIMRAQDIMRALRSRSNNRQRPKYELDYLDRLLEGLF